MNLLILGGTRFVGRHIVEEALTRKHNVTVFHRGQTGQYLFPKAEKLRGDRSTADGLSVLAGRAWDAVIDTCGYFPKDVRASAQLLKDETKRYLFISSISVYADFSSTGIDESGPVAATDEADATEVTNDNYGALKVLCEAAALEIFGNRAIVVRPGLIVGPHDPSGRFPYWPARIARGGEVLAPGNPKRNVQFIDARDLARFAIDSVESDTSGIFNATGPAEPLDMRSFLEACRSTVGGNATFTWVSDAFLEQAGVAPYTGLPLWTPDTRETAGAGSINCSRAIAAGLKFRPLEETVADTFEWYQTKQESTAADSKPIGSEKETEILEGWHRLTQPYRV